MLTIKVKSATYGGREIKQHTLAPGMTPAIGAWAEEFELHFYSDGPRYQVCPGIDGRALVPGAPQVWSPTIPNGGYIVEPSRGPGLVISAWPEDTEGGRRLIWTPAVATHGVAARTLGANPWAKTITVAVWQEAGAAPAPIRDTWEHTVTVFLTRPRPDDIFHRYTRRALETILLAQEDVRDTFGEPNWKQFAYESSSLLTKDELSNYDLWNELLSIASRFRLRRLVEDAIDTSTGRGGHEVASGTPDPWRGGTLGAPVRDVMRTRTPADPFQGGPLGDTGGDHHTKRGGGGGGESAPSATPDIGVGAGSRVTQKFIPARPLVHPRHAGSIVIATLWWDDLCKTYDAICAAASDVAARHLPTLPPVQVHGAPMPGMDLGEVPSVEPARPVPGAIPGQAKHGDLVRLV